MVATNQDKYKSQVQYVKHNNRVYTILYTVLGANNKESNLQLARCYDIVFIIVTRGVISITLIVSLCCNGVFFFCVCVCVFVFCTADVLAWKYMRRV